MMIQLVKKGTFRVKHLFHLLEVRLEKSFNFNNNAISNRWIRLHCFVFENV